MTVRVVILYSIPKPTPNVQSDYAISFFPLESRTRIRERRHPPPLQQRSPRVIAAMLLNTRRRIVVPPTELRETFRDFATLAAES